jgi:2-keto-4-pentenoate hydratase/2-oxohepta-3-ene-1,7-dioic acid hydratase in catechol pathway
MKLFAYQQDQRPAVGVAQGGLVFDLGQACTWFERETHTRLFPHREFIADLLPLIRLGDGAWSGLASLLAWLEQQPQPYPQGVMLEPAGMRLLAPIRNPSKIVCVGLNYRDHCRETGTPIPKKPIFFCKFPSSIIGPDQAISWPAGSTTQVDYEAELAVVIKKTCKGVSTQQAGDYIAGFTILNDISARDAQFDDGQWVRGKSFDTFCPLGPDLVTPDEVGDPGNLAIRCRLNGQVMQDSNTRAMIFGVNELISYLSETITLEAGDILSTGTPHGVGFSRTPTVSLSPGDDIEVEIQGLGILRNHVV